MDMPDLLFLIAAGYYHLSFLELGQQLLDLLIGLHLDIVFGEAGAALGPVPFGLRLRL